MQPPLTTQDAIKHALISIFIGFCISALTVLFQAAIHWLQSIPAQAPGFATGVAVYVAKVHKSIYG